MRILNLLFLVSIIVIACSGCGNKNKKSTAQLQQANSAKPPAMQVETFIVQTRPLSEVIEVPGSLLANETTEIHPEISGRVVKLNVAEGKFISRGALLAKIYDGDLQAQLRKLQVQLQIAEKTIIEKFISLKNQIDFLELHIEINLLNNMAKCKLPY